MKVACIDVETYDPDLKEKGPGAVYGNAKIIGIAYGDSVEQGYIPIEHGQGVENTSKKRAITFIEQYVKRYDYVVGANILYDLENLAVFGVHIDEHTKFLDIQYAAALLNEYEPTNMVFQAKKYGTYKDTDALVANYAKVFNVAKVNVNDVYKSLANLDYNIVAEYAKQDVRATLYILEKQIPTLISSNLWNLFLFECSLIYLYHKMRMQPIRIDKEVLASTYREALVGHYSIKSKYPGVNLASNNELGDFLIKKGIHVPPNANPKSHVRYVIDKDWLQFADADDTGIIEDIKKFREYDKLKSNFLESYIISRMQLSNGDVADSIHTVFHPLRGDVYGTVSGRFSSSNPNLQNIPPGIRNMFIPNEDHEWIKVDRSQIEFRLLVEYAVGGKSDEARRAYLENSNTDFHVFVMELTGLARKQAKICNFLLVYGGSEAKLRKYARLDALEASRIYTTYHNKLPFVKFTYNRFYMKARNAGEIRTLLNRRRVFAYNTEYRALNGYIQGCAADIMKIDMLELWQSGIFSYIGFPLLTVHDELAFSVDKGNLRYLAELKDVMEKAYKEYADIKTPLLVNISKGPSWGEQEEYIV